MKKRRPLPMSRGIIFSSEMVRAILEKEHPKTQTRRVVTPIPTETYNDFSGEMGRFDWMTQKETTPEPEHEGWYQWHHYFEKDRWTMRRCPYKVGQHLWVRETWMQVYEYDPGKYSALPVTSKACREACKRAKYRATDKPPKNFAARWRSARFMPRWASRIDLVVTNIRVQRVSEITSQDAWEEGARCSCMKPVPVCAGNIETFKKRWDVINAKRGFPWYSNPWVWCIGFKRISRNEAIRILGSRSGNERDGRIDVDSRARSSRKAGV